MGVPRLFRFLAERYPCLFEEVTNNQILDFDNLYLDMNGIFHQCASTNTSILNSVVSEELIFKNIFYYIEVLFNLIKPKNLLFLAVDGVAPRAKMNQQRARRFSKAKEKETEIKKLLSQGKKINYDYFDSNCISPGTTFMDRLNHQLSYFISSKLSSDPLWRKCKIIFSGHQEPGEGEHKIMNYIRYLKTLPDHDPTLRHCVFSADVDLIMLTLSTHEHNFYVLREKAQYLMSKRPISIDEIEFQLINIPFLKDYLDLEFKDLKKILPFPYDLEHIVDDWILLTFLLGNDFIPNLPDININTNALPLLYKTYKEVLPKLEGYLNENGFLNLARFQEFMLILAEYDMQVFEESYVDLAYLENKMENLISEGEEKSKMTNKYDLDALIKSTNEMFPTCDIEDVDEDEHETFLLSFCQKKRNYYSNKLGLGEMTDELLKSQAKEYIQAIQWNLHYYFHGCTNWMWFYPQHYSPYVSDIVNFKDFSLDSESTQPLLPYEQLLAILPPQSNRLLPEAYRHLMTSPDSPIIDLYPKDFETDVPPNKFLWEGIILIPFVDVQRLKEAMEPFNDLLTKEEKMRNKHDCAHIFTYTEQNLGMYKSPGYFPDIKANHGKQTDFHIPRNVTIDNFKLKTPCTTKVSSLKCSTLKNLSYTTSLKHIKVFLFRSPSREESLVLTFTKQDTPLIEELAPKLLGKIVNVNWPNLIKARVISIASFGTQISLDAKGKIQKEELNKEMADYWAHTKELLTEYYLKKKGVEVGDIEIIVYVQKLDGWKCTFDKNGKPMFNKLWASKLTPWPLQTVIQDVMEETNFQIFNNLEDAFPEGSTVFVLEKSYFGSKGQILPSSNCISQGFLNVAVEIVEDIRPDVISDVRQKSTYLSCRVAATTIGISIRLLQRITGSVFFISRLEENSQESEDKVNIGLKMKLSGKDYKLPGYTKKDNNYWEYSEKAVKVISEYVKAFPDVMEYLATNLDAFIHYKEDLCGKDDVLNEMVEWIETQEYKNVEFVKCDSEVLELNSILKLEEMLSNFEKKVSVKSISIAAENLYKNDFYVGKVSPVVSSKHRLLDRVVCIRSSYMVPTGLRGVIIGIHKNEADEADNVYDILFDEPFMGGIKLYSSDYRVYKMTENCFLNLTNFDPILSKNLGETLSTNVKETILPESHQTESLTAVSAFAKWNQDQQNNFPQPLRILARNHKTLKEKENDKFQKIWENLQNKKPQEETLVLRQILKINDPSENVPNSVQQEKEKVEIVDSVKSFFQNMTIMPQASCESHDNQMSLAPCHLNASSQSFVPPLTFCPSILQTYSSLFSMPKTSNPSQSSMPKTSNHSQSSMPKTSNHSQSSMPKTSNTAPTSVPKLSNFSQSSMPTLSNPSQPLPIRSKYFSQLCEYYKKKNLSLPKFNTYQKFNTFTVQILCADGFTFSGVASNEVHRALNSAARNACSALGIIPETYSEQSYHKIKKAYANDNKKKIQNDNQPDMNSVVPKPEIDSSNALGPPLKHEKFFRNNLANRKECNNYFPQRLPPPPQQWVMPQKSTNQKVILEYKGTSFKYSQADKNDEKNQNEDKKNEKKPKIEIKNQKTVESALGFVPLQAITGKRNFKPIATTTSAVGPNTNMSQKTVQNPEPVQPVKPVTNTPNTIVHKMTENRTNCKTKQRTQRSKRRIAANLNLDPCP